MENLEICAAETAIPEGKMAITAENEWTRKLILVPVFVFFTSFFSFVARHRFIDGDEGFYLLASRLVLEHKAPYMDFFYTQAPLLPYAYALWIKLFGISWFSARSFSAALTTILGLLICEHVCQETRRWVAGLAAVVLFASSTHLRLVSACEDLFSGCAVPVRCLCNCHSALVDIVTMAGRGCGTVIWAERGYPLVRRRARANFPLVDISPF